MPPAQTTHINNDIERPVVGYVLIALLDREAQQKIAEFQAALAAQFGDFIWNTPPSTLHITLMDWLAPFVDYNKDKNLLFDELFPAYDKAFARIANSCEPITVDFAELRATPGAVISVGHDNGEFQTIRTRFLNDMKLLPGTKQPPAIIHSSLARYRKEVELQPIVDFIAKRPLAFTLRVDRFHLVREDVSPQLRHELLKEYILS